MTVALENKMCTAVLICFKILSLVTCNQGS